MAFGILTLLQSSQGSHLPSSYLRTRSSSHEGPNNSEEGVEVIFEPLPVSDGSGGGSEEEGGGDVTTIVPGLILSDDGNEIEVESGTETVATSTLSTSSPSRSTTSVPSTSLVTSTTSVSTTEGQGRLDEVSASGKRYHGQ